MSCYELCKDHCRLVGGLFLPLPTVGSHATCPLCKHSLSEGSRTFTSEPDHLLFQTWVMAAPWWMEPLANSTWPDPVIKGYLLKQVLQLGPVSSIWELVRRSTESRRHPDPVEISLMVCFILPKFWCICKADQWGSIYKTMVLIAKGSRFMLQGRVCKTLTDS